MSPLRFPAPLCIDTLPTPSCDCSVVIPACNEADQLPATLSALAWQQDADGKPLDPAGYEVIVLVNNSSDDSLAVVQDFAQRYPWLQLHGLSRELAPEVAHVGWARRLLLDAAYTRLCQRPGAILACTDADTQVDRRWISALRHEMAHGASAVAGWIGIHPPSAGPLLWPWLRDDRRYRHLSCWLESQLDPDLADPWPRHHHHTGANLALTVAAYQRSGGLPPLPVDEDLALIRQLIRQGCRIRHSLAARVYTSARCQGRATGGMASQLQLWSGQRHGRLLERVEPVVTTLQRLRAGALLRHAWPRVSLAQLRHCAHYWRVALPTLHTLQRQGVPFPVVWVWLDEALQQAEQHWRLHGMERPAAIAQLSQWQRHGFIPDQQIPAKQRLAFPTAVAQAAAAASEE